MHSRMLIRAAKSSLVALFSSSARDFTTSLWATQSGTSCSTSGTTVKPMALAKCITMVNPSAGWCFLPPLSHSSCADRLDFACLSLSSTCAVYAMYALCSQHPGHSQICVLCSSSMYCAFAITSNQYLLLFACSPFPVRLIWWLHGKYVIWATEKFVNGNLFLDQVSLSLSLSRMPTAAVAASRSLALNLQTLHVVVLD